MGLLMAVGRGTGLLTRVQLIGVSIGVPSSSPSIGELGLGFEILENSGIFFFSLAGEIALVEPCNL